MVLESLPTFTPPVEPVVPAATFVQGVVPAGTPAQHVLPATPVQPAAAVAPVQPVVPAGTSAELVTSVQQVVSHETSTNDLHPKKALLHSNNKAFK